MNEFRRAARQQLFSCAVAVLFKFQGAGKLAGSSLASSKAFQQMVRFVTRVSQSVISRQDMREGGWDVFGLATGYEGGGGGM